MGKPHQQELYEVLQVSPQAHPLIVAKAFRLLAALYHPDNKQTGDPEAFRRVTDAYRLLSDPVRRAAYNQDRLGSAGRRSGSAANAGADSLQPTKGQPLDERELRPLLLRALYDMRRAHPYKPGLSLMVLAELCGCSIEDLEFTLWYLRGKRYIDVSDDSDVLITVAGVDYVEASGLAGNGAIQHETEGLPCLPPSCDQIAGWSPPPTVNRNGSAGDP